MSESITITGSAKLVSDAAALSLVDIRRIDLAVGKSTKRGDLTHKLKRGPNGEAPMAAMPATVAPSAAPVAAPTFRQTPKRGDLTHMLKHEPDGETPMAAMPAAVAPPAAPVVTPTIRQTPKRGDLTHLLKHGPDGEAPLATTPAPVARSAAPVAAPTIRPTTPVAAAAIRPTPKRGDLTHMLKRGPNGAAPLAAAPGPVAPSAAPVAAPPLAPTPVAAAAVTPPPVAAPTMPPAPELPPFAAFATGPAAPPVTRRAVALPEPYVAPSHEPAPTYIVGGLAMLPPLPAPPPPGAAQISAPLPYDDVRPVDELIDYWDTLRGGRELPFFSRLDRTRIAISWPNTLMVSFDADQMPQLTRLSRFTSEVAVTSMVTEWILSCARRVARLGKAVETERDFPSEQNTRRYQLLLLPFASATGTSDYILCNLCRTG